MTPRRLLTVLAVTATCLIGVPAGSASAHGGADVDLTSDYRTRITEVSDIAGLKASTVGLDGSIRVTWAGTGTLIVAGYEGEPYLRFDSTGVAANRRSPATWINQDRYGAVDVPDDVDADAEPDWSTVAAQPAYQWHDHRTHWMNTAPPPQAQTEPERSHVIYERWEIPLTIDGTAGVIAGDLTWTPAPPLLPWIALISLVATVSVVALWSRHWRPAAAGLAAIGAVAIAADTVGYVAVIDDNLSNRIWAFIWTLLTVIAAIRLAVHARRRTPQPTLAMFAAGLILFIIAAVDRSDVFTAGFYLSSLDVTLARLATATAIGVGLALTIRFLAFLGPQLIHRPPPPPSHADVDLAQLPVAT